MFVDRTVLKKRSLVPLIADLVDDLELTKTQRDNAESRYTAVGNWLSRSEKDVLAGSMIFAQGSTVLGTTVKPIGETEHDVDLLCFLANANMFFDPAYVKECVGERLRENDHYASILEEKQRCWRLNYAGAFHLDITPSVKNPSCGLGGELVPDKALKVWKPTNPQGYRKLFEKRAALRPRMLVSEHFAADSARAKVEPYPAPLPEPGFLRRVVQIGKRHRDVYFENKNPQLAPISVIITTLVSRSYEYCVQEFAYNNGMDLLNDVAANMLKFIEVYHDDRGKRAYAVWNETTAGEDFAEKWNHDESRAEAFHRWHRQFVYDLREIENAEGLDQLAKRMSDSFGEGPTLKTLAAHESTISASRHEGRLCFSATAGLTDTVSGTLVRPNTFFGST